MPLMPLLLSLFLRPWWRAPEPAKPALETDLKTLADAANEAAKREAAQWFYFVTVMITLAAIVGSTTHRVLFLEAPVKVPLLSIDLPLVGFYVAAPAIFLVLHFYLLAQVREMRSKILAFLDMAEKQANQNEAALRLAVKRLDPFPVAALLAAKLLGDWALALKLMVWTTLALAPLGLLLFMQIRFLPYHDPLVTWWHRLVLATDLAMLWWLWPRTPRRWHRWTWPGKMLAGMLSAAILIFAGLLATVPGEHVDGVTASLPGQLPAFQSQPENSPLTTFLLRLGRMGLSRDDSQASNERRDPNLLPAESFMVAFRRALFDSGMDATTQQPRSIFSRNLVLPDQVFLTVEDRKAFAEDATKATANIPRTLVLRGRDLRNAVLDRADLRRADLTGAQLQDANLRDAHLQGVYLVSAQLQGANLGSAQLQGANLGRAQLQGANLGGAQLQGANLWSAQLQDANLRDAHLQGANLWSAQLQGAYLVSAQLQGANLGGAQLQGAVLRLAAIWRAIAESVDLEDADLRDLGFEQTPPRDKQHPDRTTWQHWIDAWFADVPQRDQAKARERLAILTQEPDPAHDEAIRTAWIDRIREAQLIPHRRADRLARLGCAAAHAPYVARSILRHLDLLGRGDTAIPLLAQFEDPKNCPGIHGFTDEDRKLLARWTASTSPPTSRPNVSAVTP
jgi:uncharacterized protein YjbI with pentapeptide repeats